MQHGSQSLRARLLWLPRNNPDMNLSGKSVAADNPNLSGRRVVGEINLACGQVRMRAGKGCADIVPSRTVLGIVRQSGAFREFLTLP
jgi:threonine dehydrogenase-like Zn-dependent dehydrogenase